MSPEQLHVVLRRLLALRAKSKAEDLQKKCKIKTKKKQSHRASPRPLDAHTSLQNSCVIKVVLISKQCSNHAKTYGNTLQFGRKHTPSHTFGLCRSLYISCVACSTRCSKRDSSAETACRYATSRTRLLAAGFRTEMRRVTWSCLVGSELFSSQGQEKLIDFLQPGQNDAVATQRGEHIWHPTTLYEQRRPEEATRQRICCKQSLH